MCLGTRTGTGGGESAGRDGCYHAAARGRLRGDWGLQVFWLSARRARRNQILAMEGWEVTVSQISGLQLHLTLHAHDRYSRVYAQIRRQWGIPDRCQRLVWKDNILRKEDLCELGPDKFTTISLVTDLRVETLLGTNRLPDWQEAADLVACWACRDCEGALPLLRSLQDHFIAHSLDRRPDTILVASTVTITTTRREADLLLMSRNSKPYAAFSCKDGPEGTMQSVSFHTRTQCRYKPGHTSTLLLTTDTQLGFKMLQPAAEVVRAMLEIQVQGAEVKAVLEDLGLRDLHSDLFHAVVQIMYTYLPSWMEWIWGMMRQRLSRFELGHESRVLKLFFEGQHVRPDDLILAEARLSMFPTEPRGVAAKIIRTHGRAGHPRTVRALTGCVDELLADVAPTIPRTLGLIAKPGDVHAVRSLRGCIFAVRQAVPRPGLGERGQHHWHEVQTSLMKQLIIAMGRLGESAGPGLRNHQEDMDWEDFDSAQLMDDQGSRTPGPSSALPPRPGPAAAARERHRILNRRLG